MKCDETSAATIVNRVVIPRFVESFYGNNDSDGLLEELQKQVSQGTNHSSMTLQDIMYFLSGAKLDGIFGALNAFAVHARFYVGFSAFYNATEKLTLKTANGTLKENPIILAKNSGDIHSVLYRKHASFMVRNLACAVMLEMFEILFSALPMDDSDYMGLPIGELDLEFQYIGIRDERLAIYPN